MKLAEIWIIVLSVFFGVNAVYGQSFKEDVKHLAALNTYHQQKTAYQVSKNNSNELQIMLSGLFLFYKNFISSQDGSRCAFHQSCSEYALLAVKQQGAVIGGVNFFDRFTRCNTCSPYQYTIHPITNRFDDPVR
jgi:uncharacterized protein